MANASLVSRALYGCPTLTDNMEKAGLSKDWKAFKFAHERVKANYSLEDVRRRFPMLQSSASQDGSSISLKMISDETFAQMKGYLSHVKYDNARFALELVAAYDLISNKRETEQSVTKEIDENEWFIPDFQFLCQTVANRYNRGLNSVALSIAVKLEIPLGVIQEMFKGRRVNITTANSAINALSEDFRLGANGVSIAASNAGRHADAKAVSRSVWNETVPTTHVVDNGSEEIPPLLRIINDR